MAVENYLPDYLFKIVLVGSVFIYIHCPTIRNEGIIVVGEDGKAVLAGFLFQIRQHFRIDASFKQYFSVLCFYYLATVIGENNPSIIAEFEGFGQWHCVHASLAQWMAKKFMR